MLPGGSPFSGLRSGCFHRGSDDIRPPGDLFFILSYYEKKIFQAFSIQ
jgi:hypothetical protein